MTHSFWIFASFWTHIAAAFLSAALAIWLWHRSTRKTRPITMVIALAITSFWALTVAMEGYDNPVARFAETLRNMGWLVFMYRVSRSEKAVARPRTVIAIYSVLAGLLVIQPVIDGLGFVLDRSESTAQLIFYASVIMRMLFSIGALVLVHNFYTMSSVSAQANIKLPVLGLAAMWVYDLNLYTVAYLSNQVSPELLTLRGVVVFAVVPMFALAAYRSGNWKINMSRTMAFQSLSLVAIGGYLAIMVIIAQTLQIIGGDYARLAQISFVFGMSVAALVFLPSGKFRAWLKVKIAKHLFQHRYDYRSEWMRFTDTIGRPGDEAIPFHERVIQAVADIPESASGILLTPNDNGRLELQARWNWPTLDVPATACKTQTIPYFESTGDIVELNRLRAGKDTHCNRDAIPEWLLDNESIWVLVPLVHFDRLAGLVALSRPPIDRRLDWEDFDMLRVVGSQVASYLAEEKGQEALLQARQFDEFNRRFAFVMHDIKNIVSQLSLTARNAEKHADNPEFRADMVDTLRGSVDRMNKLIGKLSQYGLNASDKIDAVPLSDVVAQVAAEKTALHDIHCIQAKDVAVLANSDNLEQVIGHLLQNAIDASNETEPVIIKSYQDGLHGCVEIFDTGCGMTADFVRSELFKPFVSSKNNGFGIGAYEARTLVEAMNGRIDVESREGEGSRFVVRLPLSKYAASPGKPEAIHQEKVA